MAEQVAALLSAPRKALASGRAHTTALCVVLALGLAAVVIAGQLLQQASMTSDLAQKNIPPCWAHPFGTDQLGRDMLCRTVAGLSTSILVGLVAAAASSLIAVVLGAVAALGGKRADHAVGLLVDLMMGVPHIVLLLMISFALGKGAWGVIVGVALTHWPSLTRVLRAEMLQCKQAPYVRTARLLGVSAMGVVRKHMVPHILPQLAVGAVLLFPHAILHEAAITFLGFGLSPEQPAIGIILSESMAYLSSGMWWLAVLPGVALVIVVMAFDAVGRGLRHSIDPTHAQD